MLLLGQDFFGSFHLHMESVDNIFALEPRLVHCRIFGVDPIHHILNLVTCDLGSL